MQAVAILITKGMSLRDIWQPLPWEGSDMPSEYLEAFIEIFRRIDLARLQQFGSL